MTTLTEARQRHNEITSFMQDHTPVVHSDGFVEYAPCGAPKEIAVVSFTGRGGTPSDAASGMHQTAAHAALKGCCAVIASAHEESRQRALEWLQAQSGSTAVILGHSHGGNHASDLAAEYFAATGRQVQTLYTIDPVNSPWPWPLKHIKDRKSVMRHINFFQRNALWYGGNIPEADENYDVSNPEAWPAWSILLRDEAVKRPKITHTTIDEDMFLNGSLTRDWQA